MLDLKILEGRKSSHSDNQKRKDSKCNRNQDPSHYLIRTGMLPIKYKINKFP